jgi:predicted transcriptional regulator
MEFELETRRSIYEQIKKSPGIHYRELERRLQMVPGNIQYHLHHMEKNNLILASNDEDYVRYFVKDKILNEAERKIISFLRRFSCRHIILQLLNNPEMNNKELSQAVCLTAPTVSWNLKKLLEAGIIERKKQGRISKFTVVDPPKVTELLVCYKESFLDTMIDYFLDMWELK